jgi:hypothetical protein
MTGAERVPRSWRHRGDAAFVHVAFVSRHAKGITVKVNA